MQGPTQQGDEPPDPRERTISMPRIEPSWLPGKVSEREAAADEGTAGLGRPGFLDPYALPTQAESVPAAELAPTQEPEPAVMPAAAATAESAAPRSASSLPEPGAEPSPATQEPADPAGALAPATRRLPGADSAGHPPRRAVRRAEPGVAGKPLPGSIAELRARLDKLPDGHPSSPYDDAGWLKPSPTRLRQLELGLPARPAGYAERFGIDPENGRRNDGAPAASAQPLARTPDDEPAGTAVTAPPAQAGRAADDAPADDAQGLVPQTATAPSWPADGAAADPGSGPAGYRNGHRPPASPHEASGPARPAPDRGDHRRPDQGRGDVPRRGAGVSAARPPVAPEHRDLADRILATFRAAEGRNERGGYGTSGLTPVLRRIAAQLPAGGLAPASEADALKPADRFTARLARLIDRQPGRPPAELAATISDGIRYAFTFPADDYTEGTLLVHRKLKAQGFDLEARRNQWGSREYKGVFTRWRDPAHGLAFEVQFHTSDSWAVVKQTHDTYLRITDPVTPAAERARLRARMAEAAATLGEPPGCLDIADFRAGGSSMSGGAQYFVIVADQHRRAAAGLARRRNAEAGPVDETLRGDLTWQPDSAIVEWEYGDLAAELVPISESEAENLSQAFRARWRGTR